MSAMNAAVLTGTATTASVAADYLVRKGFVDSATADRVQPEAFWQRLGSNTDRHLHWWPMRSCPRP